MAESREGKLEEAKAKFQATNSELAMVRQRIGADQARQEQLVSQLSYWKGRLDVCQEFAVEMIPTQNVQEYKNQIEPEAERVARLTADGSKEASAPAEPEAPAGE